MWSNAGRASAGSCHNPSIVPPGISLGGIKSKALIVIVLLLCSITFVIAAIPHYRLEIDSPSFKRDGIYEVSTGEITFKWTMIKKQWFQEKGIAGVGANVTIREMAQKGTTSLANQRGELKRELPPGKYQVRIDTVEQPLSQSITLEVSEPLEGRAILSGTIVGIDNEDIRISGAQVTIDEIPGMKPVESATNGVFTIKDIPKKYGEAVRICVIKEGYESYSEDVVLGKAPPKIKLKRKL